MAVGKDHLGHGAAVAVLLDGPDNHILAEGQLRGGLPGAAAEVLAGLGSVDAVQPDLDLAAVGGEHGQRVAVGDTDDAGVEIGRGSLAAG